VAEYVLDHHLGGERGRLIDRFLAQCDDPRWWTQTIAFTAVQARARAG
jgi:hypothetical protein